MRVQHATYLFLAAFFCPQIQYTRHHQKIICIYRRSRLYVNNKVDYIYNKEAGRYLQRTFCFAQALTTLYMIVDKQSKRRIFTYLYNMPDYKDTLRLTRGKNWGWRSGKIFAEKKRKRDVWIPYSTSRVTPLNTPHCKEIVHH